MANGIGLYTKTELAKKAGITYNRLENIFNSISVPTAETIIDKTKKYDDASVSFVKDIIKKLDNK